MSAQKCKHESCRCTGSEVVVSGGKDGARPLRVRTRGLSMSAKVRRRSRMGLMRLAVAEGAAFLLSGSLLAHDTRILPVRPSVESGESVTFDLTSGMAFPANEVAVKPNRLERGLVRHLDRIEAAIVGVETCGGEGVSRGGRGLGLNWAQVGYRGKREVARVLHQARQDVCPRRQTSKRRILAGARWDGA